MSVKGKFGFFALGTLSGDTYGAIRSKEDENNSEKPRIELYNGKCKSRIELIGNSKFWIGGTTKAEVSKNEFVSTTDGAEIVLAGGSISCERCVALDLRGTSDVVLCGTEIDLWHGSVGVKCWGNGTIRCKYGNNKKYSAINMHRLADREGVYDCGINICKNSKILIECDYIKIDQGPMADGSGNNYNVLGGGLGIYNYGDGNITINDCYIRSADGIYNDGTGKIVINNGTIISTAIGTQYSTEHTSLMNEDSGTVEINGGTFLGQGSRNL